MEEVHHLLASAYSKSSHIEAASKLFELESLIISLTSPVDNILLKQTRKISLKFGYSLYGVLPKLYIKYLKLVDKGNTELLISLCNDALIVKESLIGTDIGDQIESSVREALIYLVQQGSLDPQQSQEVQKLLEVKPTVNFEEHLGYAIEELEQNSGIGMHIMIDLFSTMSSVKDQFYFYSTQVGPLIQALQPKRSIEIYNLTLKFMDIFLAPLKYLVKVDTATEYQLSHLKLFASHEDVFYTSLSMLKILMKSDRYINENSVRILYKLWNLYPGLRSHLYDLVSGNFKTISLSNSLDPRKKAAEFLYFIMHDKDVEGDFKGRLESEGLENLFEDENYDKAEIALVDIKDLKISSGYPICCEIKPGEKYSHFVDIEEANSILTWGFASEEYDISYTISRMDTVEEILFKGERLSCDSAPVHGVQFIHRPGLYKFEWNNSFSWFRSKKVRFRISVLIPKPFEKNFESNKVILLENPDECGDLCYILPNIEHVEIGVHVTSDKIKIFGTENDEFPLKPTDDIPNIIQRYCSLLSGEVKKVGVIEKSIEKRNYLHESGCYAVCRDIDAFALMNHDNLQVHTLIAVIESEGLRSAVMIGGKLFPSGNVANLKNQEPAVAISTLLSLFGPGTVVVSGFDFEKLLPKVRLLVPISIWNHSQIVLSGFSLSECAARLHYLLYRYKASL